jgi:hypothetical protein
MKLMRISGPVLVAMLAASPLVLYLAYLVWDCSHKIWKIGWDGTPMTFNSPEGICTFVGYGLCVVIIGVMYSYLKSDRGVGYVTCVAATAVATYGLAFAFSLFGVL